MLRFAKNIDCRTDSWLTLIILGLITEKLIMRTSTFLGPRTYRARVRCTSRTPLL